MLHQLVKSFASGKIKMAV